MLIRTKAAEVRETGRAAQVGVRLINLDDGERLVSIVKVAESDDADAELDADAASPDGRRRHQHGYPGTTELLDTLQRWFVSLPHCATLGFEFIGVEDGKPTLKGELRDDLVGNGSNGVIHGGGDHLAGGHHQRAVGVQPPGQRRGDGHAGFAHRLPEGRHAGPGRFTARRSATSWRGKSVFTRAVCHHGDPC